MAEALGVLAAVDVATGTVRWKFETEAPMLANATATAGGLIFGGDLKGTLYALDSANGAILWRHDLSSSAGGGLFTYALKDKQYVAAVFGPLSAFFPRTGTTRLTVLALP